MSLIVLQFELEARHAKSVIDFVAALGEPGPTSEATRPCVRPEVAEEAAPTPPAKKRGRKPKAEAAPEVTELAVVPADIAAGTAPWDDAEEEVTVAQLKDALLAYSKKTSTKDALAVVQKYAHTGKLADVDAVNYSKLLKELA